MARPAYSFSKLLKLKDALNNCLHEDYPTTSRLHKLKTFDACDAECFVKREDELGFGCSGSKIRKYRSLIPFLRENGYQEVIVIGGAYSNNVLGVSQLLIENRITPLLYLRGSPSADLRGNALFTSLLVPAANIRWVAREDWPQILSIAKCYIRKAAEEGKKVFMLPEGASVKESLSGCLSLPIDIIRNEMEYDISFDHIFIDAGTGMTACALMLAFGWIEKTSKIHVLLFADGDDEFKKCLEKCLSDFENLLGQACPMPSPMNYKCYKPQTAASFGAVNTAVFNEIKLIARQEGFLTDPIYSAKLFGEARRILREDGLKGRILLIHSGGALSLAGFQDKLNHKDHKARKENLNAETQRREGAEKGRE